MIHAQRTLRFESKASAYHSAQSQFPYPSDSAFARSPLSFFIFCQSAAAIAVRRRHAAARNTPLLPAVLSRLPAGRQAAQYGRLPRLCSRFAASIRALFFGFLCNSFFIIAARAAECTCFFAVLRACAVTE